ncbi:MAG: iron-containing alcohol dehydrogenase, partial [Acidobacteriota bacterium]
MDFSYALRVAAHKAKMRGFDVAVKVLPFNQPRLMIGPGSIDRLADHIGTYGFERLLLVTDAGIVELGLHSGCAERLESYGIDVVVFDEIEPNPTERQ